MWLFIIHSFLLLLNKHNTLCVVLDRQMVLFFIGYAVSCFNNEDE